MIRFLFLVLILSCVVVKIPAQIPVSDHQSEYIAGFRAHYGFIWPHHQSIRYLQRGHIPAIDFTLSKRLKGKYAWHQSYHYPWLGAGYYYAPLRYPEVLGDAHSLFTFFEAPFRSGERFHLNYRFAFGLAYLTRAFDPKENYYNIAVGSHLNVHLNLSLQASWKLNDQFRFYSGLSLTHFSNGATRMPNLGINLPSVTLGVDYSPFGNRQVIHEGNDPFKKAYYQFLVTGAAGWKEAYPPGEKTYLASSFSFNAERRISCGSQTGAGLDLFYDGSVEQRMSRKGIQYTGLKDNLRRGVHLSYGMVFGKVIFTVQAGSYLWMKWDEDGYVYNRFGLRYYFSEHLLASLTLKTHLAKADFIEWGMGYYFNR